MKVGVYISTLHKIGGVETSCINLCNRTGFDLIFDSADILSLKKLKYNAYQLSYAPTDYDALIISTAWGKSPERVKAKVNIQVIHADYKAYIEGWNFRYKKYPFTTHHVAVGNHVAKQFEKVTGFKIDKVIHNLLDKDKEIPEKQQPNKLSFITVSRFAKEKGFERMLQIAERMKKIQYNWNIYGTIEDSYAKNIAYKLKAYHQIKICGFAPTPQKEVPKHSYLVQLSDTEGFPYSIYESLQCLTPVIATDFPSVHEMIKDGKNGYILDMDLSNFDINTIKNVPIIRTFKEKSSEKDWFNFLNTIYK